MALWGNTDLVANTSTITIDLSTGVVTGAATTFSDAGVEAGNVISIGVGATMGEAVISSVTSNTVAAVATTQYITSGGLTNIPTGTTYTISEKPVYTLEDSNYAATEIYGVDETETEVARAASGDARLYKPQHAGWVGIQTYMDMHGNLRVKSETLVAGSMITLDAADSDQFPNA